MSDVVSPLLQWLNANPELAGIATFVISAAESVAVIGTIVPGSVTMTAIGTLAGAGVIPLYPTLLWAILGAIIGDGISYWIGRYFKDGLRRVWPFRNNPGILERGEKFVHKYGVMSVFIGRFVGPVRALVPLVAGMFGMKPLQFTIANILSAIGWAPLYMLPGILLGAASLELPPDIAIHVMLVLFLLFLFVTLCLWIIYKILSLVNTHIEDTLTGLWKSLKKSRYFHVATTIMKHHDPKQHHGQLILAFYFLLTSTVLFLLTRHVMIVGAENMTVNNALFHFFRSIRSATADSAFICITLLGQKQVILPMICVLFGWLLYAKRYRAAIHAIGLAVIAAGSGFIIKKLVQSPRPWGIMQSPETFSMPSGHTTLATALYIGIAFLLANTLRKRYRWMIYTPAIFCAFAVGVSRLYLGAHWFTDVVAGWLLGSAALMLVILSYHRTRENPIGIWRITAICSLALALTYSAFYVRNFDQLKVAYAQAPWPSSNIAMKEWWAKNELIPHLNVSLFGFPSQPINIEWVGSLESIRDTLLKQGWSEPPDRDWVSILHRVADIKSGEYLPLVSPQYLDKRPVLILTRTINGSKKLVVIRLWESGRIIQDNEEPLWVGTIGSVPRSFSWLFHKKRDNSEISADQVFIHSTKQLHWEWKIIKINDKKQPVLLIKAK